MKIKKILLLAALPLLLAQCSKEDTLAGTVWVYEDLGFKSTLEFSKSTFIQKYIEYWQQTGETEYAGTYTYDPPVIILTYEDGSDSGRVSGNVLTIKGRDEDWIYIKQ
jgi:hypothetical protein